MLKSVRGYLALSILAVVCCRALPGRVAWAATPTPQQRTQVRTAEAALKKAANLYRSKKFADAGEAFQAAQQSLDALSVDESRELTALAAPLRKQLAKLRDLLTAEGIRLAAATPAAGQTGKAPSVSFTKQVAPVLVARCASCHIQRARGELSMATYLALAKGSKAGAVIMPGDAQGSRLVELIESGDMPRGGGKMTAEEVALISSWITAGAKFDGPDRAAPLASFAPPKTDDDERAKLKVVTANGREEVQFARDVGPVLLAACSECHGEQNPRNNFTIQTFNGLLRGGDSGPVLVPGKPSDSLLVKKLRGLAGARMPMGRDPLEEEAIAKIEKWIALGGKFDGADPALPLEELVALSAAELATHEELSQRRSELAAKHWRLIMPDTMANREETPNLLVYGSMGSEIVADVARQAEERISKLRRLFKLPGDAPIIKGRLTLYVFDKRYDYGEVGTMLEHRELPAAWRGHWHFNPLDAYSCLLLSSDGQVSAGLLAQQIAGCYIASLGKSPRWFAEGTARVAAARFDPKDPRVKDWDDQIARLLKASDKPTGFLTGALPPEDSDLLSYSYVKYLMTLGNRHAALMTALQQGTIFDAAFATAYGGSPSQLTGGWLARASKRGR